MSAADLAGRVEAVAEGAGGRLFCDRAPGFDARALYGAPFEDDAGLQRLWGAPLDRLARLAEEIGAELVLMIAPDAHGVHRDALPAGWSYATPSLSDRLAALARARGVVVVHPREALRDARGALDPFRATDSHWSGFGGYLAYRDLMAELAPLGVSPLQPDAFVYAWGVESGDLGAAVEPPRRRPVATARLHAPRARTVFEAMNARRHALKITETPDRHLPNAVLVRDSYAAELAPFLAESFRRLVMVGAENLLFEDLIREERPQAIVIERGERTLPFGLIDPPPFTGWREHWPEAESALPDREALEAERAACRALQDGDAQAALEAADRAALRAATPDRAALLGRALELAGREGAAEAFEAAHLSAPDRPAFMLRLGVARLKQGRDAEARDLFARACTRQPWSGEAYEHLGYAALRLRDLELARYALERATRVSPHRPGGWLWRAELNAAHGDDGAALQVLARGLLACPGDAALQAMSDRLKGA